MWYLLYLCKVKFDWLLELSLAGIERLRTETTMGPKFKGQNDKTPLCDGQ